MSVELRDYQEEAIEAVFREWKTVRSTLIVHATGLGKTVTAGGICRRVADDGGRILFLAHRGELLRQACDKMSRFFGLECEVEKAGERVSRLFAPQVVAGSVQSLCQDRRLAEFDADTFDAVIVDEAHHAPAATYRKILDYFGGAKVLGVTATPDRADGLALRNVFESVAHAFELRDAIAAGYLAPIRQKSVFVEDLDLSQVRTVAGDLHQGQLEEVLLEDKVLHEIAAPMKDLIGARPTILFTVSVAQAYRLAECLQGYLGEGRAEAIDGTADEITRRRMYEAFARGDVQVMVNCALLTEGFDAPHASCVAIARPTTSRALFSQMVGRGTRLHPGKEDCLVLDFVGNAGKHRLVTPLDILDGSDIDDETRELAKKKADDGMAVHEAIDAAAADIAALRRRLRAQARARFRAEDVDPFEILGAPNRPGRWGGVPATRAQIEMLERAGIKAGDVDKGQASALISQIIARREKGLCTFKQARRLASYGLNPDVSFKDAREALDAIAANGWKAPERLFADPRFRAAGEEEAA